MKRLIVLVLGLFTLGCGDRMKEVPMDKFIGIWEIKGRGTFDGMQIKIEKQDGKMSGKIYKLNENKWVKMFAEKDDVWVSEITRSSNYQFKLSEKKLASDLFSMYGLSTAQDFAVEFIDDNTIGLGTNNGDPQKSKRIYKRVE